MNSIKYAVNTLSLLEGLTKALCPARRIQIRSLAKLKAEYFLTESAQWFYSGCCPRKRLKKPSSWILAGVRRLCIEFYD